jgi:hypothetical protein
MTASRIARALAALALLAAAPAAAQVQLRFGDPQRATYSELHEALRPGTPAADSVAWFLAQRQPAPLWRRMRAALADRAPWSDAVLALTRVAELRSAAYADSARRLLSRVEQGRVRVPPGRDAAELAEPLRAVLLERERAVAGDSAVRARLLAKVAAGDYGLADAWVLGRLGPCVAEALAARFLQAPDEAERVRRLTLLGFSREPSAIPLLARVYAAPDSFGVPTRYAGRASDALLWIGTRESLEALRGARATARTRGVYDDPSLARGGYGFLANDSSAAVSRTGRPLEEWIAALPAAR